MKLKNINPEDLELMSYTDITYMMIKESKKTMNTPTLFKEICNMLDLSESTFEDKIGDYYTSLTMDKRFVMLDNNEWDIRDNHSIEIVMDDDDDDEVEEEVVEEEPVEEEELSDDTLYDDESDIDDEEEPLPLLDEDEEELDLED